MSHRNRSERDQCPAISFSRKAVPSRTITFNRPERRNCLNEEVIFEFENLLHTVRDDRETRALIVTGTGTAFCSGADLSRLEARRRRGRTAARVFETGRQANAASDRARLRCSGEPGYRHHRCDQRLRGRWRMVLGARVRFLPRGRGCGVLGSRSGHECSLSRRARQGSRCASRSVAREGSHPDVPSLQSCRAARARGDQSNRQTGRVDAGGAGTRARDGGKAARGDREFQARHQRRCSSGSGFSRCNRASR